MEAVALMQFLSSCIAGGSERQVAAGRPPEVRVQRSAAQATGDTKAVPEVEVPAAPSEEG